jgi:hypothetical protein
MNSIDFSTPSVIDSAIFQIGCGKIILMAIKAIPAGTNFDFFE